MRTVRTVLALCVLFSIAAPAGLAAAQTAPAQPAQGAAAAREGSLDGSRSTARALAAGGEAERHDRRRDAVRPEGFANGTAAALLFWVLAFATVGGSLFVITRRNLIAAVMGLVGTFFALAALYAMLYAHFLAVIQVLVYAGAIMVLFVFVVMILNRPEDEPWALEGLLGKALAGLAILYLLVRVSGILWDVKDTPHAAVAGPRPQMVDTTRVGRLVSPSESVLRVDDWGSTRAVGKTLFRGYLFPFEAVSLVLLVAVVGGIALSHPHRESTGAGQGGDRASDPGK